MWHSRIHNLSRSDILLPLTVTKNSKLQTQILEKQNKNKQGEQELYSSIIAPKMVHLLTYASVTKTFHCSSKQHGGLYRHLSCDYRSNFFGQPFPTTCVHSQRFALQFSGILNFKIAHKTYQRQLLY